ncbi:50S ribosomal protein L21 [bacterium BMS3Abin07]|nr:50S ribosomal protein L21 [bacterium BMS3Abin07]GBE32053.1 50S ribosomal protein L21 [bacterium BMS3Bbin05]HDO23526.1 50S ribosomal protein L21 [Nitrospirota bacterium]
MYAIIRTGGHQFRVKSDEKLKVDLLEAEKGSEVEFRDVLMVSDDDRTEVGVPFIEKAVVKAEVIDHVKDKKVSVFKKKPRKGFKRMRGHRQPYTVVKIREIDFGG